MRVFDFCNSDFRKVSCRSIFSLICPMCWNSSGVLGAISASCGMAWDTLLVSDPLMNCCPIAIKSQTGLALYRAVPSLEWSPRPLICHASEAPPRGTASPEATHSVHAVSATETWNTSEDCNRKATPKWGNKNVQKTSRNYCTSARGSLPSCRSQCRNPSMFHVPLDSWSSQSKSTRGPGSESCDKVALLSSIEINRW